MPPAQLLNVPRTVRPSGSAVVRRYSDPAAGPVTRKGVEAVIRRLRSRSGGGSHTPESPCPRVCPPEMTVRSEERRGGKEGRSRGSPDHLKKKTTKIECVKSRI